MPHEIMGWKSSDGSVHETWSDKAIRGVNWGHVR